MIAVHAPMNTFHGGTREVEIIMKLKGIDLNLLAAFDVLMAEKNVTRAAHRLHISQSAMSHTLRRLRELLEDPVLISTPGGMVPTARAVQLIKPVRESLGILERTLQPPADFNPVTSDACFVIGSTDYVEYVLLPPLMKHLAAAAPNVSIRLKRFSLSGIEKEMEEGGLDVVIRLEGKKNSRFCRARILDEIPVILVRTGHPLVGEAISRELYEKLRHIVIDSFEISPLIQQILQGRKLDRIVTLRSPNFLSAPIILAESDMIATLPLKIAQRFVKGGRLKIVPFPMDVREFHLEMVWHALLDKDPAQLWFREQIATVAEAL